MPKYLKFLLPLSLLFVATMAMQCSHKTVSTDSSKASWQVRMQKLSQALSGLFPYIISEERFLRQANEEEISSHLKTLSTLSHAVDRTKMAPDADPALKFMSQKFSQDMNEAYRHFKNGDKGLSRYLARNTMNFCISCHTRSEKGRENLGLAVNLSSFSPLDRTQYLIALRDFDRALNEFDKAVNDPSIKDSPQSLELAAEKILAVAVRYKKDPDLALELLSRVVDSENAPIYLRLNARAWQNAVKEWKKEPVLSAKSSNSKKLEEARRLLKQGWKTTAQSPLRRAGLVYYLRASEILHELLGSDNQDRYYSEALYEAGLVAESLRDLNLWTLHEAYYESCIRQQPHTQLAMKCYLRYEALQLSTYADDGVRFVPAHVRDHLFELKALAERKDGDFLNWDFIEK